MPLAKDIKTIVIHCSAGFGNRQSIEAFWKSKGWRSPGYHRLIETNGTIQKLVSFAAFTNGVQGHNSTTLHICYIGGVEKVGAVFKAKDTRTPTQKAAIIACILEAQNWLKQNGVDTSKITIKGHRDFSPDQNHDGIIASWERIKECPSFDAIPEYKSLQK